MNEKVELICEEWIHSVKTVTTESFKHNLLVKYHCEEYIRISNFLILVRSQGSKNKSVQGSAGDIKR